MSQTDESLLRRANVLGIGVHAINMPEALACCHRVLQKGGRRYICLTGVHGVMEAQRDPALRNILNSAFLCLPDGMPTVWVGRLQGMRGMSRVYGPDFMWELCRLGVQTGCRHFLYGGKPGVAQQLQRQLQQRIPGIQVVGTYSPPFGPLSPPEEEQFLSEINESAPDIVWVGLSTPKQEAFMAQYIEGCNTRLMVGVGAAFDIHAGLIADAPAWMKSCGLQWLDRLHKEPRRLWRRYLTNNPQFLWQISLQLAGLRKPDI